MKWSVTYYARNVWVGATMTHYKPFYFGVSMSQYTTRAKELGELVERKQAAYGHSYERAGEVLRVLYPNGVQPGQYQDFLAVVRVVDKLFRIATGQDTQESPWQDIAGYGLLGVCQGHKG